MNQIIDIDVSVFETVNFHLQFRCKSDSRIYCLRINEKTIRGIKHFSSQENDYLSRFLSDFSCKEGTVVSRAFLYYYLHRGSLEITLTVHFRQLGCK